MEIKALDLFQAYAEDKLPREGGYLVSSFLNETSTYSKFEVVAFNTVKSLFMSRDGLTFQSDGNKIFILVEPPSYSKKYLEPFRRESGEHIPHRFSELEIVTARDQSKVMISKDPIMTYGSFTVMKPTGINFSFVFYNLEDVFDSISRFFVETLNKEAKIAKRDAKEAADAILNVLERFTFN